MFWSLQAQSGRSGGPAFNFLRCEIRADVRAVVERQVALFGGQGLPVQGAQRSDRSLTGYAFSRPRVGVYFPQEPGACLDHQFAILKQCVDRAGY